MMSMTAREPRCDTNVRGSKYQSPIRPEQAAGL